MSTSRPYQWTADDDEIALDAIIVGIAIDDHALALGLELDEPTASIYWPDWITQGDMVKASMEGPYTVPDALERAEMLCAMWAYKRVVISLQDRSIWREDWGALSELEGLD